MIISASQIRQIDQLGFDLKATQDRVQSASVQSLETQERIALNQAYRIGLGVPRRWSASERILASGQAAPDEGDDSRFTDHIERHVKVMRAVCRVRITIDGEEGMGTGFLIAPNVLLTNHHVIPSSAVAATGMVDFGYEYDAYRREKKEFIFRLDPQIFVSSPELDFTLVGVNPITLRGENLLEQFGYLPLNPEPAKALLKDSLSIIQHPGGGRKKTAFRNNQLIKITDHFLWYVTDTDRGSSGAPVFNDAWEVVGLHHSGVVRQDDLGQYYKKDGNVWDGRSAIDDNQLDWIANEAVRVSSILQFLQKEHAQSPGVEAVLTAHTHDLWQSGPKFMGRKTAASTLAYPEISFMDQQPYNIFMPITVVIGNGSAAQAPTPVAAHTGTSGQAVRSGTSFHGSGAASGLPKPEPRPKTATLPAEQLLVERFTRSYEGRDGYQENFLGDDHVITMPKPLDDEALGGIRTWGDNQTTLPYRHFSVLMSRDWKLAIVTASNIDGTQEKKGISREGNRWYTDGRLAKEDHFYDKIPAYYGSKTMNHGHMVRRLDPVWGQDAQQANDDTFHLTNSAPQAGSLNQERWLDLENFIVQQGWDEDKRLLVFTAPILLTSPRNLERQWFGNYKGTYIPMAFWKVVVYLKEDQVRCAAFLMDQVRDVAAQELDFATTDNVEIRRSQIALTTLENLTGLRFDEALRAPGADAFASVPRLAGQESTLRQRGFEARLIKSADDVVL